MTCDHDPTISARSMTLSSRSWSSSAVRRRRHLAQPSSERESAFLLREAGDIPVGEASARGQPTELVLAFMPCVMGSHCRCPPPVGGCLFAIRYGFLGPNCQKIARKWKRPLVTSYPTIVCNLGRSSELERPSRRNHCVSRGLRASEVTSDDMHRHRLTPVCQEPARK